MRVKPITCLGGLLVVTYPFSAWCETIHIGAVYSTGSRVEMQLEIPGDGMRPDPRNVWLMEDGTATVRASELKSAREAARPMAAILAVDVSGSMSGDPLNNTRKAISEHLGEFSAQDSVSLVSFASGPKMESEFGSPQRPQLLAAVNALGTRGNRTVLYDSLLYCLDLLQRAPAQRRRLLVFSDGWDETSKSRIEDVIQRARQNNVVIDAIGIGRVPEDHANSLYRLAQESRGQYVYATSSDAGRQLKLIVERLESMPLAVFNRNVDPTRPGTKKVAVEFVSAGSAAEISEELVMSIPATLLTPGSVSIPWRLVIPAAVLLIVALAILFLLRKKEKEKEGEKEGAPGPPIRPLRPGGEVVDPEPVRRKRGGTVVDHDFSAPSSGSAVPAALKVLTGSLKGIQIPIPATILHIGADRDNELAVTDDDWVSGRHAEIRRQGANPVLEDLGSRNGTFVNGKRIDSAYVLVAGDVIRVGNTEIEVASGMERPADTVR